MPNLPVNRTRRHALSFSQALAAARRLLSTLGLKKTMRTITTFTVLMSVALLAHAGNDSGLSQSYSRCIAKAGGVDPEVSKCMSTEYTLQDRRLNASYKSLMAKLSEERKKQLQETQRLWLKYVEANCDFYYDPNGGTAARAMSSECAVKARAQRAQELEDLAK